MIKIIAGRLKGQNIFTFNNQHYRPSQAKFKEGLFSIITSGQFANQNILQNAVVLDLFCGTGSLGFEAISRGAAHCTMIDIDENNLDLIDKTAINLREQDNISCLKLDVNKLGQAARQHNLVFIDPPYFKNLVGPALTNLKKYQWLQSLAIVVIEIAKNENFILENGYEFIMERIYGKSKLIILSYRNE